MLVNQVMSGQVISCTPWETAEFAANLMKAHQIGAIPIVSDKRDPLLEGIVTDRDLCSGVVATSKVAHTVSLADLMNRVPVTCQPDDTVAFCEELMRENQVRRIPVVDQRGRCVGIVAQADIALHAPGLEVAQTIAEISKPSKAAPQPPHIEEGDFYCGQPHEMDEILLLNRRRKLRRQEVRT